MTSMRVWKGSVMFLTDTRSSANGRLVLHVSRYEDIFHRLLLSAFMTTQDIAFFSLTGFNVSGDCNRLKTTSVKIYENNDIG